MAEERRDNRVLPETEGPPDPKETRGRRVLLDHKEPRERLVRLEMLVLRDYTERKETKALV